MAASHLKPIRALVDKRSEQSLEEWAKLEGRSLQMHCGILLRRIAVLYRDNPQKLEALGLLAGLTSAVA
jgi:hypothetical protein